MNRRINKCIESYVANFHNAIRTKAAKEECSVEDLLNKVLSYPPLNIKPSDYEKRQRTKNIVPLYERCTAYRANHQQCTRRRRADEKFCGTHAKGTPHGIIDTPQKDNFINKIDVWIQEINGINYYIDDNNNVYDPQDVFQNKINPRCIHKYNKTEGGLYTIIDL